MRKHCYNCLPLEENFINICQNCRYIEDLYKQLEQADEIILDIHAQITTFSKYTASRVYDWQEIRGEDASADLKEFDDNGIHENSLESLMLK